MADFEALKEQEGVFILPFSVAEDAGASVDNYQWAGAHVQIDMPNVPNPVTRPTSNFGTTAIEIIGMTLNRAAFASSGTSAPVGEIYTPTRVRVLILSDLPESVYQSQVIQYFSPTSTSAFYTENIRHFKDNMPQTLMHFVDGAGGVNVGGASEWSGKTKSDKVEHFVDPDKLAQQMADNDMSMNIAAGAGGAGGLDYSYLSGPGDGPDSSEFTKTNFLKRDANDGAFAKKIVNTLFGDGPPDNSKDGGHSFAKPDLTPYMNQTLSKIYGYTVQALGTL